MKHIEYDSDLSLDIKVANKNFKLIKSFFGNFIKNGIFFGVALGVLLQFQTISTTVFESWFLVATSISTIISTKLSKKRHQNKQQKAIRKLRDVAYQLQEEKKNVYSTNIQRSIQTTEFRRKKDFYNDLQEEKIITYFYLLDQEDQIQVLKQIRKNYETYFMEELYLLEEKDKKKIDGLEKTKSILKSRRG